MSFGFVKKICPDKILNYENFELLNEKDPVQTSQQLKPCLEGKDTVSYTHLRAHET